MQYLSKKSLVIVGIIFGLFLISVFWISSVKNRGPSGDDAVKQTLYYDDGSGEVVSDTEGKTPETYGVTGPNIIYLGTTHLTEKGVTSNQLKAYKIAVEEFSLDKKIAIKEISISRNSIKALPYDYTNKNPHRELTFVATINRTEEFTASVKYRGISELSLSVYKDGKAIFNSGYINPLTYGEEHKDHGEIIE